MLPGFIARLYTEIKSLLSTPVSGPETPPLSNPPSPTTPTISTLPRPAAPPASSSAKRGIRQPYDPYARLRPLAPHLAILNAPAGVGDAGRNSGKAPAFAPAAFPWVGGSLAGYVMTAGEFVVAHIRFSVTDR
jgi:actin-related protein 10